MNGYIIKIKNLYKKDKDSHICECAKSSRSGVIVGLMGQVPSCHHTFAGISGVLNFFSWVLNGSKTFCRRYFVVLNLFSCKYFVATKCFLAWIKKMNKRVPGRFNLVNITDFNFHKYVWVAGTKTTSQFKLQTLKQYLYTCWYVAIVKVKITETAVLRCNKCS